MDGWHGWMGKRTRESLSNLKVVFNVKATLMSLQWNFSRSAFQNERYAGNSHSAETSEADSGSWKHDVKQCPAKNCFRGGSLFNTLAMCSFLKQFCEPHNFFLLLYMYEVPTADLIAWPD